MRFSESAAADLRLAIRQAGGVEVFAIGDVQDKVVTAVTIACRGTESAVPALLERPRTGQVVIHNHPSGDLRPSPADMHLAGTYGDDGIGVIIVDSAVSRDNWVVEPHEKKQVRVPEEQVRAFFEEQLPGALPGYEPRPQQVELALQVLAALHEDRPLIAEAGTGTGKSLAYLVPSALWALANDSKVVVSTFTRALQAQLLRDDLPILGRAGVEIRAAVLQGRNNYLCKRRLGLAVAEDEALLDTERDPTLPEIAAWDQVTEIGARGDLPVDLQPGTWERIESDSDLTLRVRCPHYEACHYYQARRNAAAAHIVVSNHALLMADLSLKKIGAQGVLPTYHRLVIDEGHHLEDAATGALAARMTLRGLQRASAPLLHRGRRRGAIERIATRHAFTDGVLDAAGQAELETLIGPTTDAVSALRDEGAGSLEALAAALPGTPVRLTEALCSTPTWQHDLEPPILRLLDLYEQTTGLLGRVLGLFDEIQLPEDEVPPIQELARARRRLLTHQRTLEQVLDDGSIDTCRWISPPTGKRDRAAVLQAAPIRVAPVLKELLWEALPGTIATSATLTVNGRFGYWAGRVGLYEPPTATFPSPFDYPEQALLGLPRDLPLPEDPAFLDATAQVMVDACRLSGGGTFVLCTSYKAVDHYARVLRQALPASWPVLPQGRSGRDALLRAFRESRKAVLVGTDAFWEGVSVRGLALRQVIVPRLPFRVPTEPLHEARVELEQREGRDPFRSLILPHAVLRLRQGFGRLIRSQSDRGVVLLLDRRLHERMYGRRMLHALPDARRVQGSWRPHVHGILQAYWEHLAAEVRAGRQPRG